MDSVNEVSLKQAHFMLRKASSYCSLTDSAISIVKNVFLKMAPSPSNTVPSFAEASTQFEHLSKCANAMANVLNLACECQMTLMKDLIETRNVYCLLLSSCVKLLCKFFTQSVTHNIPNKPYM